MPKMIVNDDTVTFPLKGRDPVVLDEPCAGDLGWLTEKAGEIDERLTPVPTLRTQVVQTARGPEVIFDATAEEIEAFNAAKAARNTEIYSGDMPYLALLVEAIKRFSGGVETVDAQQLYGWAASPLVVRTLLEKFRDPLPGPE